MLTSVSDLWKWHIINELKFCSSVCKNIIYSQLEKKKHKCWKIPILSLTDFGTKSQVHEKTHANLILGPIFPSASRSLQENTELDPWEGGSVCTEIKIFYS